ncbi:dirigent protein 1 [Cryptomeria japonica]|uniref:dirigent protein 1 n=1 Tax=Cryptomeria japonica TaxID=3369 RepID=UPI0025ABC9B9|nr:dirigent protein 1 [Cryptomeria japonica]
MTIVGLNPLFLLSLTFLLMMGIQAMEVKKTQLQFYMHDIVKARNATAVKVTPGLPAAFGMIYVMDDPLTEGPQHNSRAVGRATGMYLSDSLKDVSVLMVFTVVFGEGMYNGSTLSFQGQDSVFLKQRELSVVGGTGFFRFVTGHAIMETHYSKGLNAVLRFNITVVH